ncbi:hypothetical protein HDV02_001772 [Globomyces sp. JEL0801]|nr:hypothetical protein HDV02_001772 [Globomyces sp. JEL0801]
MNILDQEQQKYKTLDKDRNQEHQENSIELIQQPLEKLKDAIKELTFESEWLEEIKDRLIGTLLSQIITHSKYKVSCMVAGAVSSGKSTSVNAILGDNFSPTSSFANTCSILNVLSHQREQSELYDHDNIAAEPLAVGINDIHKKITEMQNANRNAPGEVVSCNLLIKTPFSALSPVIKLIDSPGSNHWKLLRASKLWVSNLKECDILLLCVKPNDLDSLVIQDIWNVITNARPSYLIIFVSHPNPSQVCTERILLSIHESSKNSVTPDIIICDDSRLDMLFYALQNNQPWFTEYCDERFWKAPKEYLLPDPSKSQIPTLTKTLNSYAQILLAKFLSRQQEKLLLEFTNLECIFWRYYSKILQSNSSDVDAVTKQLQEQLGEEIMNDFASSLPNTPVFDYNSLENNYEDCPKVRQVMDNLLINWKIRNQEYERKLESFGTIGDVSYSYLLHLRKVDFIELSRVVKDLYVSPSDIKHFVLLNLPKIRPTIFSLKMGDVQPANFVTNAYKRGDHLELAYNSKVSYSFLDDHLYDKYVISLLHLTSCVGQFSESRINVMVNSEIIRSNFDPRSSHEVNGNGCGLYNFEWDRWSIPSELITLGENKVEIVYVYGTSKYWLQEMHLSGNAKSSELPTLSTVDEQYHFHKIASEYFLSFPLTFQSSVLLYLDDIYFEPSFVDEPFAKDMEALENDINTMSKLLLLIEDHELKIKNGNSMWDTLMNALSSEIQYTPPIYWKANYPNMLKGVEIISNFYPTIKT